MACSAEPSHTRIVVRFYSLVLGFCCTRLISFIIIKITNNRTANRKYRCSFADESSRRVCLTADWPVGVDCWKCFGCVCCDYFIFGVFAVLKLRRILVTCSLMRVCRMRQGLAFICKVGLCDRFRTVWVGICWPEGNFDRNFVVADG